MAALQETPYLLPPAVFPNVQNHHSQSRSLLDVSEFRSLQIGRSSKVEIKCRDRRLSVPLLDVTKNQQMKQACKLVRNSAGAPVGEKSPLKQFRDIVPLDTTLSVLTLSQSKSPLFERPEKLDLPESSPAEPSEMSSDSPPTSDDERKRRRKRSPRAQRERRENKRTVYLQRLPPSLSEADVVDMLSEFGRVQHVDWVGDDRAACFARFESQVEAKNAIESGAKPRGNITISSKKEQLEYIRAELGRLQNQHSALLEQLVPKRKNSLSGDSECKNQEGEPTPGIRRATSISPTSLQNIQKHRRARSESVTTVLACDSSTNWRRSVSPRVPTQSLQKFAAAEDNRRHQRSMSEISVRTSGAPRLNLKKSRKPAQCVRVAKGPDGSRGFSRHSQ